MGIYLEIKDHCQPRFFSFLSSFLLCYILGIFLGYAFSFFLATLLLPRLALVVVFFFPEVFRAVFRRVPFVLKRFRSGFGRWVLRTNSGCPSRIILSSHIRSDCSYTLFFCSAKVTNLCKQKQRLKRLFRLVKNKNGSVI